MALPRLSKPEPRLFTRCPDCYTTFRVTPELLAKADGQVRCGRCHSIFDAFMDLREDDTSAVPTMHTPALPDSDADPLARTDTHVALQFPDLAEAEHPDSAADVAPDEVAAMPRSVAEAEHRDALDPLLDAGAADIEAMSLLDFIEDIELPSELASGPSAPQEDDVMDPAQVDAVLAPRNEADVPAPWPLGPEMPEALARSTLFWRGLSAVALLLLVLQATHHFRRELAIQPAVGPVLVAAYDRMGLPIVAAIDLTQYEIVDWVAAAGPVPGERNTLRITARIRNNGTRAAPFPAVRLTLTDRWEAVVGRRIFSPEEYLADTRSQDDLLVAGRTVPAVLAVLDPGPDAYGFELDLCAPTDTGSHRCASDRVFQ